MNLNIVKCVKFYSAHVAAHGKNQELYDCALITFRRECGMERPNYLQSWKILYYTFNRLIYKLKKDNAKVELTSGKAENSNVIDHELDSLIHEVDHCVDKNQRKGAD